MKNRQNELEVQMTNEHTYGQEKYCAHCWACVHGEECFALPESRAYQCLCAKAEKKLQSTANVPFPEVANKEVDE